MSPTWETATDWDNAQSEDGVVHEAVTNTDHSDATIVKQGYRIASPYLSANLEGYWPLHEDSGSTAYDQVGTNDGSVSGATVGVSGLLGTTAYSFTTDDYFALGNVYDYVSNTADVAITVWFKVDSYGGNQVVISNNESGAGFQQILRVESDGNLYHYFNDGSSTTVSVAGPATGTWALASAYYDHSAGEIGVSVNAGTRATTTVGSPTRNSADNWDVGRQSATASEYWEGDLADVRVYNAVPTTAEEQTLYDVVATGGALTGPVKTA